MRGRPVLHLDTRKRLFEWGTVRAGKHATDDGWFDPEKTKEDAEQSVRWSEGTRKLARRYIGTTIKTDWVD